MPVGTPDRTEYLHQEVEEGESLYAPNSLASSLHAKLNIEQVQFQ